jgi:dienelactone hydrolase
MMCVKTAAGTPFAFRISDRRAVNSVTPEFEDAGRTRHHCHGRAQYSVAVWLVSRARAIVAVGAVALLAASIPAGAAPSTSRLASDAQPIVVLVPPNPRKGFNFSYFLKVPLGKPFDAAHSLLVETNNTGLDDDLGLHTRGARFAIEQGIGAPVADMLRAPFLMPVFPRTKSSPLIYTHALDRDTVQIREGELRRIDLQLLAMIDDAQARLRSAGYVTGSKVLLVGFSASGTFANRFSLLHPERVAAIAIGGTNGMAMLPQAEADGVALPYPIGTSDYTTLFGESFNVKAWLQIPQLLFMGALDQNDAAAEEHKDAYSDSEKAVIAAVLPGKMLPDRWAAVERMYNKAGAHAVFRTYPAIGHGTDGAMNKDVAEFLRQYLDGRGQ